MEANLLIKRKWEDIKAGRRRKIGSFLSCNNAANMFGSFMIPASFNSETGINLQPNLWVMCAGVEWKCRYNAMMRRIDGLGSFMRYYRLKIYSSVQFDYFGDELLVVRLFTGNGVECDYPTNCTEESIFNTLSTNWKSKQYMVGKSNIEFEKYRSLWQFNVFRNSGENTKMIVNGWDIDPTNPRVMLNSELQMMFKKWRSLKFMYVRLFHKKWKIDLIWEGEKCFFANGWLKFVRDCKIESGDTLVLYYCPIAGAKTIKIVLFKGPDNQFDSNRVENIDFQKSFLKIVTEDILKKGKLFVPMLMGETFGEKLRSIRTIDVIGNKWQVVYDGRWRDLRRMTEMFNCFKVQSKETIVFRIDVTNIISARIYQVDGKEIDYITRMFGSPGQIVDHWMWTVIRDDEDLQELLGHSNLEPVVMEDDIFTASEHVHTDVPVIEIEDSMDVEDAEREDLNFIKVLKPSNVDNRCHGVLIPSNFKPRGRDWQHGEQVTCVTAKGSWKVGIVLSNLVGRFSAGWNQFVRENMLTASQKLVFSMTETDEGIVFKINDS